MLGTSVDEIFGFKTPTSVIKNEIKKELPTSPKVKIELNIKHEIENELDETNDTSDTNLVQIKEEPSETFPSSVVNADEKAVIVSEHELNQNDNADTSDSNGPKFVQIQKSNHSGKFYFSTKLQKFLIICSVCNGRFFESEKFYTHLCDGEIKAQARKTFKQSIVGDTSTLTLGPDNMWHCRICDKPFDRKNTLRKHEQAHIMSYPCEICNKSFKSPANLREHLNTHTGERPFKCHLCEASFTRKWALTSHVRGHLGDKRYPCNYCGKKFLKGPQLKVHIRMVHTKEKPCVCELCGSNFYSTTLLNEHKKRHNNVRNYKCEQCGKSFYDKKQLKKHYIAHSDERPYKCETCDMAFQREGTLKSHMKVHSGVKDFMCQWCGRGFAENYNLTKHLRSHANGKIKIVVPPDTHVPKEPKKKGRKPKVIRVELEHVTQTDVNHMNQLGSQILEQNEEENKAVSSEKTPKSTTILIGNQKDIKPLLNGSKTFLIITETPNISENNIVPAINPVNQTVYANANLLNIPNLFL